MFREDRRRTPGGPGPPRIERAGTARRAAPLAHLNTKTPIFAILVGVKRAFVSVLLLVGLASAVVYNAVAREREYRRLIVQGNGAAAADETFAAIEAFSGAITLKDDAMLPYLRRGEMYRRQGDLKSAQRDLREANRLDPSATRPLEQLGDVLYALGQYERAAERYQTYTRVDDRSARIFYKLALARYTGGNLSGAIASLRQAVALKQDFHEAYYLLGLCLRDRHLEADAQVAFTRAADIAPGFAHAHEQLADLYRRERQTAAEISRLDHLAALEPDSANRQVQLGEAYARAGQLDRAIRTLGAAAERFPDQPDVHVARGRVWLEIARRDGDKVALTRARDALEAAVAGGAVTSEAFTILGQVLLLGDNVTLAERTFEQATRRFPVDSDAFLHLAVIAERHGRARQARDALIAYETLRGDQPSDADYARRYRRIAALSSHLYEPAVASRWLERAIASEPADAALYMELVNAKIQTGAIDEARRTIEHALQRHPDNPMLLATQERLQLTP